jgi:hypothetical protein
MPTFPITATRPSYWAELHALDRYGNVFYVGETVALQLVDPTIPGSWTDLVGAKTAAPSQTPKPFTGHYYVRNYYGALVASGTLTASTSISLGSSLPCGWYKVFLTQTTDDATYHFAGGSGTFMVWPVDSRFQSLVGKAAARPRRNQQSASHFMRGAMMHGPNRYVINDAINYNVGSPGDLDNIISCIQNEIAAGYHHPSFQDAARPHRTLVSFVANANATAPGRAGVTTVVQTLCTMFGADKFWFEGPANEPGGNGVTIAGNQQTFYTTVKAAVPAAMVIGPCPVSINHATEPNNAACMAAMAAMVPVPVDGMSFHFYNCVNGDLTMGRRVMEDYIADLATYGLDSLPRFQTEQGFKTTENGTYMVRFGARWDIQMLLLFDQYNLPKEHCHLWYDASMGFWAVPHFWEMADATLLPPPAMLRTLSAELYGKTYSSKLDFGTPGNDMMLGNVYVDTVTGNKVIALQAAGGTDHTIQFTITGASSIVQVDCFGNTSTLTVTGGKITVATALEPVYLRIPAAATATLIPKWTASTLERNLAMSSRVSGSGSSGNRAANQARVINGIQDNSYYYNIAATQNNVRSPYFDDTGSFPATLILTWPVAQRIDRVILFASPPWQALGTVTDFDVDTWDGAAWVTQATISEPIVESTVDDPAAVVFPFVDYQDQGGCQHASFFSDRWIFDVPFAGIVSTTKVRFNIRNATYGMPPTLACWTDQAGDKGTFGNNFVIREVNVFDSDLAVQRVVLKP